jgi:hypothetical protein
MTEGGSGERENAKIYDATKIYSSLSRFEAQVYIFSGYLRGGQGGGVEFQYYGTGMLLIFLS